MNDSDVIAKLKERYSVSTSQGKHGTCLTFPGVSERFSLSTANNELTMFTEEWHEHFPDLDALLSFLDGLFAGTIQIVIKMRGHTPVGHQAQVLNDGEWGVVSHTGSLIPFFWRKKSYKTLKYNAANKSIPVRRNSADRDAGRSARDDENALASSC